MNRTGLLLLMVLSSWTAICGADSSPLPPDVPRVRYHLNPFYSQEGFYLGQWPLFSTDQSIGVDLQYTGYLQVGNALPENSRIMDPGCEADYNYQVQAERKKRSPDLNYIAELINERDRKCVLENARWQFNVLDQNLVERFSKKNAGSARSGLIVAYYYRAPNKAFGWILMGGDARVVTSDTTNYVKQIWSTSDNRFKPTNFFSKFTGSSEVETPQNWFEWFKWNLYRDQTNNVTGYVVRASLDDTFLKTYEIIVQDAQRAGVLARMSVDNHELFDHIVLGMLSGKVLRINYVRLRSIPDGWYGLLGYNTNLRVISVEAIDVHSN